MPLETSRNFLAFALIALFVLLLLVVGLTQRVGMLLVVSASVALPAALLATLLGTVFALLLAKTDAPSKTFFFTVLIGLFLLPLHLVAAGWMAALGSLGWCTLLTTNLGEPALLDGWRGAVWVHAVAATPVATLMIGVALRLVDSRREEQALLETHQALVIFNVSIPQATPGIAAAFCWTLVMSSTEIAATDLFRVRTFAEEIYTQAALGAFDPGNGMSSGVISFVCAVGLLALILFFGLASFAQLIHTRIESGAFIPWKVRLSHYKPLAVALLVLILLLVAGIPIGSLFYQAGTLAEEYSEGWNRYWSLNKFCSALVEAPWQHRRELGVSSLLALLVATLSVAVGAIGAWSMRSEQKYAWIGWLLIALLLATPGPLIGLLTIYLLNQPIESPLSWLGALYGTWAAPLIVQIVRITPLTTLLLWPALMSVPSSLLDAARADGASWFVRLLRVALPMRWPSLLAVWIVAFSFSIGELSATALVVPPGTPPLSVRLLSLLHYGVEDRVAAICLDLLLIQTLIAGVAIWLLRRSGKRNSWVA